MRILPFVILMAVLSGCSGGRSNITADKSDYPISLSEKVRGADGVIVASEELESVGVFKLHYKSWTALMTLIPIANRNRDISDDVNEQVKNAGGQALVGMEIKTSQCFWNYFTFLGILPGCSNVEIDGNIVKVKGKPVETVPVAASEPTGG